jgi:transposase
MGFLGPYNKEIAMDMTRVSHVGLDCHRKFSLATARDRENRKVWRLRLEHKDREALRDCLVSWPAGTPVVLEGSFGWGWLSDELKDAGLEPHLASTRKLAAWRKARGLAKSDRIDSDLLSELWTQQQPRWWEVWLAPPEIRSQREWMRYRMALVGIQTGLKNRIHAVLHRHGILHEYSDVFGGQGRRFLSEVVQDEARLPASGRATLKGYLALLDQVRRQIAQVTRELRRQLVKTAPGQRLRTIPGISWILSYTIVAEVGRIERFRSAKHLASYSLLAPRSDDSAIDPDDQDSPPIGRHVGHAGRRTLKWAWIEAAHGAICRDARMRGIYDRRTDGGKRDRNRGCIAVAHELCRVAYVLWKKDMDYRADRPARPGQRSEKGNSRPEPGQPVAAMVAAAD